MLILLQDCYNNHIVTSIVQSFYVRRLYRLGNMHPWQKPIVAFILTTSLAQLCTGLVVAASAYGSPPLDTLDTPLAHRLYSINLVMTIICDSSISASLVYFLKGIPTGFKMSRNVISLLVVFSISIGLLTSIMAACTLLAYYLAQSPNTEILYSCFAWINGKLYFNSMLAQFSNKISKNVLTESD
ncbi:hypothetical protein H2248_008547 [Termitomyces sp. 'cryptogamus']|nr:hypothetical protein H2248_008547 [Termitomyces sp. 'cryptogamus']